MGKPERERVGTFGGILSSYKEDAVCATEKWEKPYIMIKRIRLMTLVLVAFSLPAMAQVTLGDCIEKARQNYPQIKERGLIKEAEKYDLSNAKIGWLPQLNISGKATYQSDVVEMPFEIPGYEFNLPHDQYSLVAELSQTIWDGGATASKKRMVRADAELQDKQLDVSLYAVRQRVENVFLGILLIDKQIKQNEILLRSLRRNRDEVAAMIESGLSYKADLNIVDVNILNCRQKMTELLSDRGAYVIMLSRLTGENMTDKDFVEPAASLDMDLLDKCRITAPLDGLVLTKFAEEGEMATAGKSVLKMADMDNVYVRAYVTTLQLSDVKIGDAVDVAVEDGTADARHYEGRVTWISDEAEFTPKNIQTKDERADLVYAVKVSVPNDGYLKIGMYAYIRFRQ